MAKLTKNQQQIIDLLTSEFTKINGTKVTSSSGLIDVEGIVSDHNEKMNLQAEITLNNKQWVEVANETARKDFDILKDDIAKLGLKFEVGDRNIIIGSDDRDYSIKLSYYSDCIHDPIACMNKTIGIKRRSYLSNNHESHFNSLEEFTSHERFKYKLKYLYERSQQGKK